MLAVGRELSGAEAFDLARLDLGALGLANSAAPTTFAKGLEATSA